MQTFFFAHEAGPYNFSVPLCREHVQVFHGDLGLGRGAQWSRENAALDYIASDQPGKFTVDLTQGQLLPMTWVLYLGGFGFGSDAQLRVDVATPSGAVASNDFAPACDGAELFQP